MKTSLTLAFLLLFTACNKESDFGAKAPVKDLIKEDKGSSGGAGGSSSSTGGSDSGTSGGSTGGDDGGGSTGYVPKSDNFTQYPERGLDILWVVDNSGSMQDEQLALGNNFDVFINSFVDSDVDFKMAITTTDPGANKCGVMVAGSDVKLTSAAAAANRAVFINDFKSLINVGVNGSGDERGLQAAECFKTKNASFFRESAYLIIVEVSDEEDHSPSSVQTYVDAMKALKPNNPANVKFYSIVDSTSQNPGSKGQRYLDASTATNGEVGDIKQNFAGVLSDMGDAIQELLDSFVLTNIPVSGSIKVYVNNQLVPSSYYTYSAQGNAIKFAEAHVPESGASIKVDYKYAPPAN